MIGPYELNQIYTGDSRLLSESIPDNSIDLIFTDPVYCQIEDYEWLAKTAARVLKGNGAVLIWSNGKWHRKNTNWLESFGLTYRNDFAHVQIRFGAAFDGKIIRKCNRVTWLDLGGLSKLSDYVIDGFAEPTVSGQSFFHWAKSSLFTRKLIEAFPGIVLDPFSGGGTIPAVCKMLCRDYLAFEIDPVTAEKARERVFNTQPPLFVPQPIQIALEVE